MTRGVLQAKVTTWHSFTLAASTVAFAQVSVQWFSLLRSSPQFRLLLRSEAGAQAERSG